MSQKKMQGHRAGFRSGNRFRSRGCRALCCTTCSRISVSSEGESLGSERYASVSSLGHYMVQERLAQLIKEREQEEKQQNSQCESSPSLVNRSSNSCSLTSDKDGCLFCEDAHQQKRPQYTSRKSKKSGSLDIYSNIHYKQKGHLYEEEDRARKLIEARKDKQKRVVKNGTTITASRSSSSRRLALMVAIEKSSGDPRGDFRQSMVEVILANRIEQPKDLRYLLDCYLSVNPKEYKEVILEVFHQVCSDIFLCC